MKRDSQKEKYQGMVLSRVFMSNVETRPQISQISIVICKSLIYRSGDGIVLALGLTRCGFELRI